MSSRFLISLPLLAATVLTACHQQEPAQDFSTEQPHGGAVITSALAPGLGQSRVTTDARAAPYYNNPQAVAEGKRLYRAYNCSGCHSNGGGGMGPALMDDQWIYGGRLEQIHQTLVEGRPNGMPAWGGKVPDEQLWQISAYVRSMSLPETIARNAEDTPSQLPAPVPPEVQNDPGWSPPKDTTNPFGTTVTGPGS